MTLVSFLKSISNCSLNCMTWTKPSALFHSVCHKHVMRLKQRFIVCYVEKIGSSKDVALTENLIAKAVKVVGWGCAFSTRISWKTILVLWQHQRIVWCWRVCCRLSVWRIVKHYDNNSGYGILVCSRGNVDKVRTSLSFLKEIGIAKVRFSMIATKSIEKRALSVLTTLKEMKEKENP